MNPVTVFFELETGGVDARHPNIQLAAVAVQDWNEVGVFERKIQFDPALCDPEALWINGYQADAWNGARPESEVMGAFREWLAPHARWRLKSARTGRHYNAVRIAGHNVAVFDVPRIQEAMARAAIGWWFAAWFYPLDTYQLALWDAALRGRQPEDFKLETLLQFHGIPRRGQAHEALSDVRACVDLARRISSAALELAP